MKHQPQSSQHVNPNLIPMIDIMFLLLLFFMLGADMGHRELETVRLPKAAQATPDRPEEREHRLTINAHHPSHLGCTLFNSTGRCDDQSHWRLIFRGDDCTDPKKLSEALVSAPDPLGRPLAERKVMIRADAGAPFGLAQRAMNVCAQQGIFRIEVGAAKPRPQ